MSHSSLSSRQGLSMTYASFGHPPSVLNQFVTRWQCGRECGLCWSAFQGWHQLMHWLPAGNAFST